MAATSTVRACNERVAFLRIFADANGESHMEDIDINLQPRKLFKDNPPLRLTDNLPTSWYNVYVPTGVGETGWHNPPQRLLVLWLTGELEFETSDGDIRRLSPGSVVLAEDTTGKGHITRHPPEGQLVVHVAVSYFNSIGFRSISRAHNRYIATPSSDCVMQHAVEIGLRADDPRRCGVHGPSARSARTSGAADAPK